MNNKLIIDERQRDIGNFLVGRYLPFIKKRLVGPFTFIDHMGPSVLGPNSFMDVDQHPHIGLSTLSYLIEGEIEHKDSLGSHIIIKPGDVAFMTSGKGVTHTERTPQYLRKKGEIKIHGVQIWVALPEELEEMNPQFQFFNSTELPIKRNEDYTIKLVAGDGFGLTSPLQGFSPLFMVDIQAHQSFCLSLANQLKGELAIVVISGSLKDNGEEIHQGQMLISKTDELCKIQLKKGTHILIFGGEPLKREPFLLWNFVSTSKTRLEQAKQDWIEKKFPKIESDKTYIPFPSLATSSHE